MANENTWVRAATGAAISTPLAMLFNRYILGNKSRKSAAIAAALGLAAGGTGGYLYDKYGYRGGKPADVKSEPDIPELTDNILRSSEERAAYRERLIANGADPEKVDAFINQQVAKLNSLDDYRANPEKYYNTLYTEDALDSLTPQQRKMFDSMVKRVALDPKLYGRKLPDGTYTNYSGVSGLKLKRFQELYERVAGTGLYMSRPQLLSRMAYHDNLRRAHQILRQDSDGGVFKNPVALDYIAMRAMPEHLRKHLPVSHRLQALQRAIRTRGHSYSVDRQLFFDPEAEDADMKAAMLSTQLTDASAAALNAAGKGKLLVNLAAYGLQGNEAIQSAFGLMKPKGWGEEYGNSLWDNYRHNREVTNVLWDPKQAAIYDFMVPDAKKKHTAEAISSLLPEVVDMGFDTNTFIKKPTLLGGGFWLGQRGFDAGSAYESFKNPLNSPEAATNRFVDKSGKPLPAFHQILLSKLYGHTPNTGLAAYAASAEDMFNR